MYVSSQESHSRLTDIWALLLSHHLGEFEDRAGNILSDFVHLLRWRLLAVDSESQLQAQDFLKRCSLRVGDLILGDLPVDLFEVLAFFFGLWVELFAVLCVYGLPRRWRSDNWQLVCLVIL